MDDAVLRLLLDRPPKLHVSKGKPASWGMQSSFLRFMTEVVTPTSLTLETGTGVSTVCFALIGSEHICISPAVQEHDNVRAYCRDNRISTDRVRFVSMRSQDYFPASDLGGRKIDFALIDGSHAFPNPVIDYYFINKDLAVGGLLAIDDLAIPSVGILHRFLITDPAYKLVRLDGGKTGVYRKTAETRYPYDWQSQAFNRGHPDLSYLSVAMRIWERLKSHPAAQRLPAVRKVYYAVKDWPPWARRGSNQH